VFIVSHTEASRPYHPGGIGEIANTAKIAHLLGEQAHVADVYQLFGGIEERYEPLALMNYALAEGGYPILEEATLGVSIQQAIARANPEVLLVFSLSWSVGALLATGIHHKVPTACKFYVFHPSERVIAPLYTPSHLLITESLLANQKGIAAGIPAEKMVYLPHHYPIEAEKIVKKPHKKCVIGMVSRLDYRKNCPYAFEAVRRLVERGHDIHLYFKGSGETVLPKELQEASWVTWDPDPTPQPEVLELYGSFDLFLHLSGFEGGSNIVVEMLGLGIPTVVLDATTNPSLFTGGVAFVKTAGMIEAPMPYAVPDLDHLVDTLEELIIDRRAREALGERGRRLAKKRFHPERTRERLPLILEATKQYHRGERGVAPQIQKLYEEDLRLYGI